MAAAAAAVLVVLCGCVKFNESEGKVLRGNVYACSAALHCVNTGKNKIAKGVIEYTELRLSRNTWVHSSSSVVFVCACVCVSDAAVGLRDLKMSMKTRSFILN